MTATERLPILLPGDRRNVLTARQREVAESQRTRGRSNLTSDERATLAAIHDVGDSGTDPADAEVLRLLTRPLSVAEPIPDYYRYTCLHVVSWFMDRYPGDPVHAALLALHTIVEDLYAVEYATRADTEVSHERLGLLTALLADIGAVTMDPVLGTTAGELVFGVAMDPTLARRVALLAECTRFPRSDKHEEQIFLRTVQASEAVFFLIRRLAVEVAATKDQFPARAVFRLSQAHECASLLIGLFRTLSTLTPEGFLSFRPETGAASAVQSMNYHAMEIALFGYDPRKAAVFATIEHLDVFTDIRVQRHQPLSAVLAGAGDGPLADGWQVLSRLLARWRGSHFRFARTYLPAGTKGSGDTEGAGYVRKFMKKDFCLVGTDSYTNLPLLSGFLSR